MVFGLVWLTIATVVLVVDPPDPRGLLAATQAQEIEQALADGRTIGGTFQGGSNSGTWQGERCTP